MHPKNLGCQKVPKLVLAPPGVSGCQGGAKKPRRGFGTLAPDTPLPTPQRISSTQTEVLTPPLGEDQWTHQNRTHRSSKNA